MDAQEGRATEYARPGEGEALVEQCVTSVTTDRTMAEIAAGTDVWNSNRSGKKGGRAKRKAGVGPPPFQRPQLATLVDAVPGGNDWLHEYKYDGYRLLLATAGGAATAWTRNGNDWSDKFRGIVRAASKLPAGCLIDGEAVALDKKGKPSFQLLQSTVEGRRAPILPSTPSICWSIRARTFANYRISSARSGWRHCSRRASPPILYGDHVIRKGEALFDAICKEGGEGNHMEKGQVRLTGASAAGTG